LIVSRKTTKTPTRTTEEDSWAEQRERIEREVGF